MWCYELFLFPYSFKMKTLNRKKQYLVLAVLLFANIVKAQYTYTRYSLELSAGSSVPLTSIPGEFFSSGFADFGFRMALSKYLSGKLSLGYGQVQGDQTVLTPFEPYDNVRNYLNFNTSYYYFNGSALLNLERVLNLRSFRMFNRLNTFLVVGGGIMYPDVKVESVYGQIKNYNEGVRFYINNYGLDFRYHLSHRFDLNFGGEFKVVQTYYLDGAYEDKKYDNMVNGYVGLVYNIGANADKKHLEWFNLDGKEDIIFRPMELEPKKGEEPIVKEIVPIVDSLADRTEPSVVDSSMVIDEPKNDILNPVIVDSSIQVKINPTTQPNVIKDSAVIAIVVPAIDSAFQKVGRFSDLRIVDGKEKQQTTPVTVKTDSPIVKQLAPITQPNTSTVNLNSVNGIVPPMGKYNVIVGTYASARYAYYFRDKLRKDGYQAALFRDPGKKMIRVCIYYGDDRAEANKQLRKYLKQFNQQVWIHTFATK